MMAVQRALLDGRADIWATRQSIVPDLMIASGLAAKMATATGGRTDGKQSGPKATDRQLRVVPMTRAEDRLRYLTVLNVREMTGRGHRAWQIGSGCRTQSRYSHMHGIQELVDTV